MDEEEREDFELWVEAQPGPTQYNEARSFLSEYLGVNRSKAEVQIAKLQKDSFLTIENTYKTKSNSKRVFLKPLNSLSEEDIEDAWSGSGSVEVELDDLARTVHDRTGHNVEDIKEYIRELDSAVVTAGRFRWSKDDY
ncbi:MAG: hypothetical protein ABEH81_01390 [Halopenitus sp.]